MNLTEGPPKDELVCFAKDMLDYAFEHPCFDSWDCRLPGYGRMLCESEDSGRKYRVCLTLELFDNKPVMGTDKKPIPPPRWHGSICPLHEVGSPSNKVLGLPEEAILNPMQWGENEKKIAKEILGLVMGSVILEEDQRVDVIEGAFSLHWVTQAVFVGEQTEQ